MLFEVIVVNILFFLLLWFIRIIGILVLFVDLIVVIIVFELMGLIKIVFMF